MYVPLIGNQKVCLLQKGGWGGFANETRNL